MAKCHYCSKEVNVPKKRFCNEKCHLLNCTEVKEKGCWDYKGFKGKDGYGQIKIGGKVRRPHRISYQIYKGKIDEGFNVCHSCDNPICVNPEHLWLGTPKDNMDDMLRKGRKADKKGELHHLNKLKEEDIYKIRKLLKKKNYKQKQIAKMFGVDPSCICYINAGKRWSHI